MKQQLTLKELVRTVLQKMSEMDYKENTILNYRRFYKRFMEYAQSHNEEYFTEELGAKFLLEKYGCTHDTIHENSPTKKLCVQVRYIRVLGDFQLHGIILRRKLGPTATSECPAQFKDAFECYRTECQERNLSFQGTYSRFNRIRHFIFFIAEHGVRGYNDVTPDILADYVKTFINYSNKGVAAELVAVRCFLRFLFQKGYIQKNMSEALPTIKNYYSPSMPMTWEHEDLDKLFASIDRGNPTGKRDYTILLMIARYGIRCSDVKNLKLENIDWEDNTIQFNQHKTGKEVIFPLLKDVGWALIDYLKNGRPITDSKSIFVRHHAPYEEFGPNSAMNRILVKYIRQAGIEITRETPCGMHSLRHTLASTLLANNVPLPVISEILGHTTMKSTDVYLHIDHARLAECALNPEEVFD
ncbi:MAG TPA: integrase [Eubacteriaceae bacterium]|nr:integrase [Eubacteriaceae bacterium]